MNGRTGEELAFSIYIHIPFCRKKCPYCHFYVVRDTQDAQSEHLKDKLLETLLQELDINAPTFPKAKKLVSIYWGGGTPALFGPERMKRFMEALDTALPSMTYAEREVTLEANPESMDRELLEGYKEAGINRLSLGVQSFQKDELTLLGRGHSAYRVHSVIDWSIRAGIDNISIDLMYDVPNQTLDQWKSSLNTAFSLPISHLSLYNLTIEPKTAFFRKKEELNQMRPSEEASLEMYLEAQRKAEAYGFSQYEISAFCRPERQSRHNLGYWTGREFYGFGPSAYSFMHNRRFSNVPHIGKYIDQMKSKRQVFEDIDSVSPSQRVRELFCVGLRLFCGVNLYSLLTQYQTELPPDFYQALKKMESSGLVERLESGEQEARFTLTPRGRLVYDSVASELI